MRSWPRANNATASPGPSTLPPAVLSALRLLAAALPTERVPSPHPRCRPRREDGLCHTKPGRACHLSLTARALPCQTVLEQIKAVFTGREPLAAGKIAPTVGLNIGRLQVRRAKLIFWDLGGQSSLRAIWEKCARGLPCLAVPPSPPLCFNLRTITSLRARDASGTREGSSRCLLSGRSAHVGCLPPPRLHLRASPLPARPPHRARLPQLSSPPAHRHEPRIRFVGCAAHMRLSLLPAEPLWTRVLCLGPDP